MEKRNTLLLTVIAIATLLVAVVGATFAWVAQSTNSEIANEIKSNDNNNNEDLNNKRMITPGVAFLSLGVTSEEMYGVAPLEAYATSQDSLTIKYNAPGTRETYCTYDVYFAWDDTHDKYIKHSSYFNGVDYTDNVGKEFTLTVSTMVDSSTGSGITGTSFVDSITADENHEVDFSMLDGCDTLIGCKIGSGVIYSNTNEEAKASSVTWNFKNTIYNLGTDQADDNYGIANKTYNGYYYVTNINC